MKKKKITLSTAVLLLSVSFAGAQTVQDANVLLSNISSNSYFSSYDNNTKMVNDLNFMVLADGTNSSYVTPSFTIKAYIWDGSNPTFVKTWNDAGIYHFGSRTYSSQSIDLSTLQLPAGSYRLGIFVDADDDIPSPPDDPSDNAYLLAGNINFTPGGGTTGIEDNSLANKIAIYPNPASDKITISIDDRNVMKKLQLITLSTTEGRIVKQITLNPMEPLSAMDISNLSNGIYILTMSFENETVNKKFIKN